MSMPLNVVLHRRPEVSSREIERGAILIHVASGEVFELNAVGFDVWSALDGVRDLTQVCEVVAGTYNIERTRIASDVSNLIDALMKAGLVEIVPGQ